MGCSAEKILNYWWSLELFNPRTVPELCSPKPQELAERGSRCSDWSYGTALPWQEGGGLPTPKPQQIHGGYKHYTWEHRVYLGVYEIEKIYAILSDVFGRDEEEDEKHTKSGEGALASLTINPSGNLHIGSLTLSSAVWGASKSKKEISKGLIRPGSLTESEKAINNLIKNYEIDRVRKSLNIIRTGGFDENDEQLLENQLPVDQNSILKILTMIYDHLGMNKEHSLYSGGVRIKSYRVPVENIDPDSVSEDSAENSDTFINSFHLEDLGALIDKVDYKSYGGSLKAYLSEKAEPLEGRRYDIVSNPQVADSLLDPIYIPAGRWPSNPKHNLARSQQFMVNRIVEGMEETGKIYGVNGPPGTGKTTLIRDIVAALVTERAKKLAELDNPANAFSEAKISYRDENSNRTFSPLLEHFTGYEVMLLSSNNSAVENISTEIPSREAIDCRQWPDADYFSAQASYVMDRIGKDSAGPSESQAWGLVSARLGNSENTRSYLKPMMFGGEKGKGQEDWVIGIKDLLKESKDNGQSWKAARKSFQKALRRVEDMRHIYVQANKRRKTLLDRRRELSDLRGLYSAAQLRYKKACLEYRELEEELQTSQEQVNLAQESYSRVLEAKPGWFENLVSLCSLGIRWREELSAKRALLDSAEAAHSALLATVNSARKKCESGQKVTTRYRSRIAESEALIKKCEAEIQRDCEIFKGYHPDSQDDSERELSAPWLNEDFNIARSELFLEALNLHRAFLFNRAVSAPLRLYTAYRVITGMIRNPPPALVKAVWQFLFLLTPTVSSTFASVPRLLRGLGQESLGWLIVDEAGQANPQEAVGVIWRSQNVLAVGDPLQLEPIAPMPKKARLQMADYFGVSGEWVPPSASVQTLVDRISRYGTYLGSGENRRWVSSPLRVHRRCADPMFSISNRVAYEGMMIFDTRSSEDWHSPGAKIYRSFWATTDFSNPGQKVQDSEFKRFEGLLNHLIDSGVSPSDIIAISPFRPVADRLAKYSRVY